jgi:16S rRNA (guanine527-N7)-methyltransferase
MYIYVHPRVMPGGDGAVNRLADGARRLDIPLTDDQLGLYQVYYETLIEWNQRVNLTRIIDYEEVQTKHFLDSLSCWEVIKHAWAMSSTGPDVSLQVIDVGSGGGFPGVVLKIASPALRLTLLEAKGKKAEFLRVLVERLGLADVVVISTRAEEVGRDARHRERYDLALARALAGMATLAELTLPLVRVGGLVIAQKGENPAGEVNAAQKAILTLGGQIEKIAPVVIPGLDGARHLVVLKKVSPTPIKYPRRPGIPAKRPLA